MFIHIIRLIKTENSNIYDMVFVFVETFRVIYTYLDSGRYCKIQTALENVTNTSSERIQRKVIVNLSNHCKVTGNIVLPHKIK